tara:strand:- start:1054 stop:1635 length:582 start_codon:yes stop_codon:yes gene_type:complete
MKALIIISHPDKNSFCYNGIFKEIKNNLEDHVEVKVADLYHESYLRPRTELMQTFKDWITWSTHIYIISPVWWFRCTPRLEVFFDEVFTPGFAYDFKSITKTYGVPVPRLKDKKVRTYITHGAPALPVITVYLNSVKLRLVMGVYTFVFGWKPSLFTKTKQFWSVPFATDKKRKQYLQRVKRDVLRDLDKHGV